MTDAELRAKAEAATPGPWQHYGYAPESGNYAWVLAHPIPGFHELNVVKVCHDDWPPCASDAAYIAAASPDAMLALLDRVEAAEAAVERVRGLAVRALRMAYEHNADDCESECAEEMHALWAALDFDGITS